MMYSKGNFINGQWKKGRGSKFESVSANSDTVIWKGNASDYQDIAECVAYSQVAFKNWSNISVEEREGYLQKFVKNIELEKERLAEAIAQEIGKPLWESRTEVNSIVGKLNLTVNAYKERCAELIKKMNNGAISRTFYKPLGVVAVLGPYNFPCHMANGHILPALLAGNAVIFKPSEKGAMSAEIFMECWEHASLPCGVISMLQGMGETGEILIKDKNVNGVCFTGSYIVGEKVRTACGTEKMCVLEMGGNSPLVVWDTKDIMAAVIATIQSAFITSGQRCSAARRLIVCDNEFGNQFINILLQTTKKIRVGKVDDMDEPFMGPVRTPDIVDKILNEQLRLMNEGGESLLLSKKMDLGNCFITPGIIDVTNVCNRGDDEMVGPFLRVVKVKSFEEAIEEANKTKYGLAAGIFTEDEKLYRMFSQRIDAGLVNWNQQLTGASGWAPFGGIKKSGNYRPSGYFAVDYCVYPVASIEMNTANKVTAYPKGIKL